MADVSGAYVIDGWALLLAVARVAPVVLVAPAMAGLPLTRVAQVALAVAVAAVVASGLDGGEVASRVGFGEGAAVG
jgi:flagellar biosynthesis protein FliR